MFSVRHIDVDEGQLIQKLHRVENLFADAATQGERDAAASRLTAAPGIRMQPDAGGQFEYRDDFTTPQVLRGALLEDFDTACWQSGAVVNCGPHLNGDAPGSAGTCALQPSAAVIPSLRPPWGRNRHDVT